MFNIHSPYNSSKNQIKIYNLHEKYITDKNVISKKLTITGCCQGYI